MSTRVERRLRKWKRHWRRQREAALRTSELKDIEVPPVTPHPKPLPLPLLPSEGRGNTQRARE